MKRQRKKKSTKYKQFNLEKLQHMFDSEQNSEQLNKIMGAIVDKQDVLSYDNKETNYVQLEEELYQQMNLIKLEDLNVVPLEGIRRKLDKKNGKMVFNEEINEIGKELNIDELKSNLLTILFINLKNMVNLLEEISSFEIHIYSSRMNNQLFLWVYPKENYDL